MRAREADLSVGRSSPTLVIGGSISINFLYPHFLKCFCFSQVVRKLTSHQGGDLLMLKINSLVNVFQSLLSKRFEVEILVSPTGHMAAFLVIDVFDEIRNMNILRCRWLEIHSLIFS